MAPVAELILRLRARRDKAPAGRGQRQGALRIEGSFSAQAVRGGWLLTTRLTESCCSKAGDSGRGPLRSSRCRPGGAATASMVTPPWPGSGPPPRVLTRPVTRCWGAYLVSYFQRLIDGKLFPDCCNLGCTSVAAIP